MDRIINPGKQIKDAINCGLSKEYTQVPNDLLRNTKISLKAKALLSILLSNKEGWHSYVSEIAENKTKEGRDAIESGIKELEKHGYIIKFRYRHKKTKRWLGSFWAYTDEQNVFYIKKSINQLNLDVVELGVNASVFNKDPQPDFPDVEFPDVEFPDVENPDLKILIIKNINKKNTKSSLEHQKITSSKKSSNGKITSSKFNEFWKMYPRKEGSKGKAKTIWQRLCNKNNAPRWRDIKRALREQKKSEQWQTRKFIPLPTTWLNQERWLDDPNLMKSYNKTDNQINNRIDNVERKYSF